MSDAATPRVVALSALPAVTLAPGPTPAPVTKAAWRSWARNARRALPAPLRKRHADTLATAVADLATSLGARTVGLYHPLGAEVDTRPLANALLVAGLQLAYPRLQRDNVTLDFVACAGPSALQQRPRSRLMEPAGPPLAPEALDLVVAPALAVDAALARLGQGGGSYDRFAPLLRADAVVVAAVASACCVAWGPAAGHDVRAHAVCTERGLAAPC